MSDLPPDEWETEAPTGPPTGRSRRRRLDRPELPPVAEALRAAWVAAVRARHDRAGGRSTYDSDPQWDGGYNPTNRRVVATPVWPRIAARAVAAGFDPIELVDALFAGWTQESTPPPNYLTTEENFRRAATARQIRRRRVADALRTEEAVFLADRWRANQSIPDPVAATRFALNDVGSALSPLFRYAVAVLKDLPDVADRWRAAAWAQLARDPDSYLEFWAGIIPTEFQDAVRRQPAG